MSGAGWTEVCPELLLGFGSSFGLSDSAQVKFGRSGDPFASRIKLEGTFRCTPPSLNTSKVLSVVAERESADPALRKANDGSPKHADDADDR